MARKDAAEKLVERADNLDQDDSTWRMHMADIADLIRPLRTELRTVQTQEGAKRVSNVFSANAIHANQNLAAGLFGNASNPADNWFELGTLDPDRAQWGPNREWLMRQSRKLLASFGPGFSEFYARVPSLYLDFPAFGTALFSTELRKDHSGFIDRCRSLATHNFDVDENGTVNSVFGRFDLTVENAAAMFGIEALSEAVRTKYDKGCYTDKVKFLRWVMPNDDYRQNLLGVEGKPVVSVYMEVDSKHIVQKEGYLDLPYFVPRWEVAEGERKGRGPGELALPDVRSDNIMAKVNLKAGEMAGDPPWGAPSEMKGEAIRIAPNRMNYGAVDRQGNQLVRRLIETGQLPFSLEMAQHLQQTIKDHFYFSLMQTVGRTGMTATEVIEINEERMRLMGPYIGRLHSEFLTPLVQRRWRLLQTIPGMDGRSIIDPPPPDLAGHPLQVVFVSPMALAQKSARAAGVARFYQAAAPIFASNPLARARVNDDMALETLAEGFAVPQLMNDDQTTMAARQQMQQVMQAQQASEIADTAAGAAQKGAGAVAALRPPQQAAA